MASRLYAATYAPNGAVSWHEWTLSGDSEILSLDTLEIPGRGPVLGLVIKRPTGIYLETIALSEGDDV